MTTKGIVVAAFVRLIGGLCASGAIILAWGFLQRFATFPGPDFRAMTPRQRVGVVILLALPISISYWVKNRRQGE
jgi:hypothetical protein